MALQGWSGLAASPNEPLIARQHDVRDGRPGPHQPRTVVVLLGRKGCRLRGGVGEGHRHDGQRSLEVAAEQDVLGCAGRGWGELATLDLGAHLVTDLVAGLSLRVQLVHPREEVVQILVMAVRHESRGRRVGAADEVVGALVERPTFGALSQDHGRAIAKLRR